MGGAGQGTQFRPQQKYLLLICMRHGARGTTHPSFPSTVLVLAQKALRPGNPQSPVNQDDCSGYLKPTKLVWVTSDRLIWDSCQLLVFMEGVSVFWKVLYLAVKAIHKWWSDTYILIHTYIFIYIKIYIYIFNRINVPLHTYILTSLYRNLKDIIIIIPIIIDLHSSYW